MRRFALLFCTAICIFSLHMSVLAYQSSIELMRRHARLVKLSSGVSNGQLPNPGMDGIAMGALGSGVGRKQYLDIIKHGVTPKGGSCPPEPSKNCTMEFDASQQFQKFAAVFTMTEPFAKVSCLDYADFASSVAATKSAGSSIEDVLNALQRDLSNDPAKLALLEGAVAAVYVNDTTPKTAYSLVGEVCVDKWH